MSVPLDRLYDFLHGVSDHDISIYRFYPYGSKKLEDLKPIHEHSSDLFYLMTRVILIGHDQEPLCHDLYKDATIPDLPNWIERNWHEATELRKDLYKGLKSAVDLSGINLNDYHLLLHSEKNSADLKLYEQENFIGVYYWSHALIARDWFRYAAIDPQIKFKSQWPETDFLIYNRAWSGTREYRLKFSELLVHNNLLPCCMTSFNAIDGIHYSLHQFTNAKFQTKMTDIESNFVTNSASSSASASYDWSDYQQTAIEIVLETMFDDQRHHLTEKILRPIACGQPFILAATAGSLQYLRDYGFQTFAPYIDETYDTVQDSYSRLECIIAEMKRISKLSKQEKNQLNQKLQKIAEQNRKRFFSQEFSQDIVNEYKNNLDAAIEILRPLRQGKNWKSMKSCQYRAYGRRITRSLVSQDKFDSDTNLKLRKWLRNPPEI